MPSGDAAAVIDGRRACLPEKVTGRQVRDVVILYLAQHPGTAIMTPPASLLTGWRTLSLASRDPIRSRDASSDMTDDASSDGKWLTYQQLAEARRISKPSAIRLVMRRHWRRQRDNERVVRVLVPHAMLEPDQAPYDESDDQSDDASYDASSITAGALAALENAIAALREQLDAASFRADAERARADRAEAAIAGERARADALRERAEARADDLALVQSALNQTQAEGPGRPAPTPRRCGRRTPDRKARGLVARLRAAWRGSDGQPLCRRLTRQRDPVRLRPGAVPRVRRQRSGLTSPQTHSPASPTTRRRGSAPGQSRAESRCPWRYARSGGGSRSRGRAP